MRQVR